MLCLGRVPASQDHHGRGRLLRCLHRTLDKPKKNSPALDALVSVLRLSPHPTIAFGPGACKRPTVRLLATHTPLVKLNLSGVGLASDTDIITMAERLYQDWHRKTGPDEVIRSMIDITWLRLKTMPNRGMATWARKGLCGTLTASCNRLEQQRLRKDSSGSIDMLTQERSQSAD